ncbi:hypothetical protein JKP88DRAFT_226146 [Tribonema minus]|uniref:Secreted protein n=1 Tax=Tribonema minus TaxID=303371 RepID=A0A835YM37_9STRA|nr:hypothetical protein JKP88DRAFT_226146 [Tribonema minus]
MALVHLTLLCDAASHLVLAVHACWRSWSKAPHARKAQTGSLGCHAVIPGASAGQATGCAQCTGHSHCRQRRVTALPARL